jgi:capsular polysaccharide biosynthesis protein
LDQAPNQYNPKTCIYGGVIIPEFGHFVTEGLSRCQSFDEHPQMPIVFTCIDQDFDISDSKYAYIRDTFDLLGIGSNRIIIIREATRINKLIVPKVGYRLWNYVVERHTRFLAEKIAIHPKITGLAVTSNKVYLSRSRLPKKANVQVPVIHGEDVFERYLSMEGFTIIHPQELTMLEQISAIANAKFVVGFIGSAFHTLLLTHKNPDHVIYLERKFNTPKKNQYKPIDQAKGISSTYLDHTVETASQFTLVDFQGVSKSLHKLGAVKNTYQQRPNLFNIQKLHDLIFNILKKGLFELTQEDVDTLSEIVKKLPNWAKLLHHTPLLSKLRSRQGK